MSWQESGLETGAEIAGAVLTKQIAAGTGVFIWAARGDGAKKRTVFELAPAAGNDARERFSTEATNASQRDPVDGVVQVLGADAKRGAYVVDMTVRTSVAEIHSFDWDESKLIALFRKIAEAVARLHDSGITHGWICPSNIVLDQQMKPYVANVRGLDVGTIFRVDRDGALLLKPFAAPEVRHGSSADNRSDVWSLGRLLQFLLLGRNADEGDERLPRLDSLKGKPNPLIRIVRRCTTMDSSHRYDDATQLVEDFRAMDAGTPVGMPHPDIDKDAKREPAKKEPAVSPSNGAAIRHKAQPKPSPKPSARSTPKNAKREKGGTWSRQIAMVFGAIGAVMLLGGLGISYIMGTDHIVVSTIVWGSSLAFGVAFKGTGTTPWLSRAGLAVVLLAILVFIDPVSSMVKARLSGLKGGSVQDRVAAFKDLRDSGETQFHSLDLVGADLSNMDLSDCSFDGTMFRNANLTGANFENSSLYLVDVTDAIFKGANLIGSVPGIMTGWETTTCDAATKMPKQYSCVSGSPQFNPKPK